MAHCGAALLSHAQQVSKEKKGKVVDARCRDLTNSSVCTKGRENPGSVDLCDWHEVCTIVYPCAVDLTRCRTLENVTRETSYPQGYGLWQMSFNMAETPKSAHIFSFVGW